MIRIVGIERLELSTFRVSGECSNQLSYIPISDAPLGLEPKLKEPKTLVLPLHQRAIYERMTGFEPATFDLEGRHSTN